MQYLATNLLVLTKTKWQFELSFRFILNRETDILLVIEGNILWSVFMETTGNSQKESKWTLKKASTHSIDQKWQ